MRHQDGYIYKKGRSWYVRYREDVIENGQVVRKQRCEKIADYDPNRYRSEKDVRPLAAEKLKPLNENRVSAESAMTLAQFIDGFWMPYVRQQKRPSTVKFYVDVWENHLRARVGNIRLRDFRTCDGERLLADIARTTALSRSSLKHIKSTLSGAFSYALRQGVLVGVPNPMRETSVPKGRETEETYAYQVEEIQRMLMFLPEPARTIVMTAGYTGLRKGELRGIRWEDYKGGQIHVAQSVWNGHVSEPKTRKSKAPVPIIKPLADALYAHAERENKPANGPIFRAGNKKPLNLDNLAKRVIIPALQVCSVCRQAKADHEADGHAFELDETLPKWHGWHSFRRGLATNLNRLGVDDKTIQAILRHSNIATTMNIYVKSVNESQVEAMERLSDAVLRAPSVQRIQ